MRTHRKIQKFLAHDSSVKAVALDPDEYYIATGSSEGNVKVNIKNLRIIIDYKSFFILKNILLKDMEFKNIRTLSVLPQWTFENFTHSQF